MGRAAIIINTGQAREKAIQWLRKAPWGTRVEFKRTKRTLPQNDLMWALLTDVSTQAEHMGRRYPPEIWKAIFMDALGRETKFVPSLDGQSVVPLGQSSSDLSKDEMSELIDLITAFGTERGVVFGDQNQPVAA